MLWPKPRTVTGVSLIQSLQMLAFRGPPIDDGAQRNSSVVTDLYDPGRVGPCPMGSVSPAGPSTVSPRSERSFVEQLQSPYGQTLNRSLTPQPSRSLAR